MKTVEEIERIIKESQEETEDALGAVLEEIRKPGLSTMELSELSTTLNILAVGKELLDFLTEEIDALDNDEN